MSKKTSINIPEFRIEDTPLSCTWIIVGPPGSGKCLAPGTPVIMYDGSIKKVEDVRCGDVLMGDDLTPRNVLTVCEGEDEMYEISQTNGMTYTVNEPHILTLARGNSLVDISLVDYMMFKDIYKDYRGVTLDLSTKNNGVPLRKISELNIKHVGRGKYHGFQINGNHRFLLGDGTVTHNTSFIENMAYYLKHRYPVSRIFIGTEGGYRRMCSIFHPLYVSNYYNEDEEKDHVRRQKICEMQNGKGYPGNYALNIIDDASDDPKIYKTKVMRGLFKLGSQHWNQLFMLGAQYAIDMPPDIRKSVSYVAIFFEPEENERKKLYNNFGGLAGSYENFCDLMDQITGDYTCLIFKKRTQSKNMEDNISYFRTKQLKDWKFGCSEYRDWAKQRYNTQYQEEIVM